MRGQVRQVSLPTSLLLPRQLLLPGVDMSRHEVIGERTRQLQEYPDRPITCDCTISDVEMSPIAAWVTWTVQ